MAIKVDGRVMPHPIQRNESDLLSKFATLGDSSELTKYLGILQSGSHNESSNREAVRETVLKRVDEVLKLEASAGQLIAAINTWALGSFKYSVGIVDWSTHQLEQLDLSIRRCLAKRRIRGGRGGINYLYLPRKLGGRGLLSVRSIARASYIRLNNYIDGKLSWLKEAFPTSRVLENIREAADAARQSVGGAETGREFATKMHTQNLNNLKTLHRAVENAIAKQPEANAELSRNWLSKEQLPPAIESTYFQIKEEQVQVRHVLIRRWRVVPPHLVAGRDMCRHCHQEPETLDHILSACTALSFTNYLDRHDQVARQVAKAIVEKFGVEWKAEYWTKAPPKQFVLKRDGKEGRLLWNPKVKTVDKVEHNHPDLILQLPEGPTAFIEFTVCRDDSVVERAKFKEDKYRLLAEDWAKKHKRHPVVLPIVVGTRGVIPKQTVASLAKLKAWGFDMQVSRLQKAAVIGSVKAVWKTLKSSG